MKINKNVRNEILILQRTSLITPGCQVTARPSLCSEQTEQLFSRGWEASSTPLLWEIKMLAGFQQEEISQNQQVLQFSGNLTFILSEREILMKQRFKIQIDHLRHNMLYSLWLAVGSQYSFPQKVIFPR